MKNNSSEQALAYVAANEKALPFYLERHGPLHTAIIVQDSASRQALGAFEQSYAFADSEYAIAKAWQNDHATKHLSDPSTIPSQYSITFFPNSIGCAITVTCRMCGETKDCTDIDLW